MTVSVAIDLALDRLFAYEVPEALQEKLAVGQLLSVPFGRRQARGFAVAAGNGAEVPDGVKLRPVTAIVDETPFFSPALLQLARQVAAYTAAPLESVLKTALPASVLKRNARAKELLFVEPVENAPAPERPLSARQRWLRDNVVRLGGGWLAGLCRELRTSPGSIRTLAAMGLLRVEARSVRRDPLRGARVLPSRPLALNSAQTTALAQTKSADDRRPLLLFGVTGSGKTEVYLQAIAAALEAGRGAIVMVPEISLTPQTVRRFASRFGDRVAVLHSALSDGERYDEWHRIRAGEARVVVGPRSAVWAPVRNLGLIVVDEEHDPSYKQGETPRYHARDVAVLRGAIEGAKVVLGSATPSLESWLNARNGKYALAEMPCRAGSGRLPAIRLVEMRDGTIFSPDLLDAVRLRLERHEQTILLLNRRGFSRAYVCAGCGKGIECGECGIPYTYHRADNCLRCHVCGRWAEIPSRCPQCGGSAFDCRGVGTQRAEQALARCFPQAKVLRMDADSVSRKHSHDEILSAFRRGDADILLGTQMIAKGLDFPNVTLVGVLNADISVNLPDFRSAERTYQLLSQVAGRAGRAELPGEVLIQSHDVALPVLGSVVRGGYAEFADGELAVRKECFFPPYCRLAVVGLRSKDLRQAAEWSEMYAGSLRNCFKSGGCQVSEAVPCALEKADGWYRWQIVMRAVSPSAMVRAWKWVLANRPPPSGLLASIDVDAIDVL